MKIPQKYAKVLGRILIAFFMTQIVTFTVTAFRIGFCSNFLFDWLFAHLIALFVGIPACLLLGFLIEKLVQHISILPNKVYSELKKSGTSPISNLQTLNTEIEMIEGEK